MSRSCSNHPPPRDSYREPPPPPPPSSHRRDDPRSWAPSQPPPPQQPYQQHPQQYQNYQHLSYNQPPPPQQYQQQPYCPSQAFTQPPPPPSSSRYLPPPFPSSSSSSWQTQDRRDVVSNGYGYQPPQQNQRKFPPPPSQQSYNRTNRFGGGGGRDQREEQAPLPRHMRWDGHERLDEDRRSSGYDRDPWGGGGGDRYRGGGGQREREYQRDDPPSRDPYQQPYRYDRGPPELPSRPPRSYQQPSQSYQHPHPSQQHSNSDHRQHQQNQSQGGGGSPRTRSPARRPTKPPAPKRQTTPTPEYEALSLQPSSRIGTNPPKKLLLLDLNGTLIYRARASSQMSYRKRPYLDALMSYLKEKWDVGVWSSATPENVERMLLFLGMKAGQNEIAKVDEPSVKGKKKDEMVLRVVWARDTLGLSDGEYNSKTITIKNLDVIFAYLNSPESLPPPKRDRYHRAAKNTRVYSPLNTFLLDDSHIKTSCQPYNHLPVPDYDSVLSVASARFFRAAEQQKDAPPPSLPNPDEIRLSDDEMEAAIPPPAAELVNEVESVGVDRSLLAVVGILERARGEESLIAWVRGGGLIPDLNDPSGWWLVDDTPKDLTSAPASASTATSDPTSNGKRPRRPKVKKGKKTQIDATNLSAIFPPSSSITTNPIASSSSTSAPLEVSSTTPWYSSPPHVEFWVRRGVDVLSGMGVDLSHGVDLAFLDSMEPKGAGRRSGGDSSRSSRNRAPREKEEKEDDRGTKVEVEEDEEMKVEKELLGDSSF